MPILYEVDRIRDGRSFTTRRVVAIQHGRPIFNLSASFHVPEEGFDHQAADAADVPDPESLPDFATRWEPIIGHDRGGAGVASTGPGPSTCATSTAARPDREAAAAPPTGCGSGPTARCPTTRSSTPASSPTRRT